MFHMVGSTSVGFIEIIVSYISPVPTVMLKFFRISLLPNFVLYFLWAFLTSIVFIVETVTRKVRLKVKKHLPEEF